MSILKMLLIGLVYLSTSAVMAEGATSGSLLANLKFTPVLGLTYSNLKNENSYTSSLEPAFEDSSGSSILAGVLVNHQLGNISLQTGLLFMSLRSEVYGTTGRGLLGTDTAKLTVTHTLNYLSIPLNIQYFMPSVAKGLFLQLGLAPSFLLDAKKSLETESDYYEFRSPDLNDDLKSFDLISNIGLGYTFPVGNLSYLVALKYNYGLMDISKNEVFTKARNSGLDLVFGITF